MAARSGDRELDRLIARFRRGSFRYLHLGGIFAGRRFRVARMQEQAAAHGMCDVLAESFTAFLREHGLNAATDWFDVNELDYSDRPVVGIGAHALTVVETARGCFTVDWTAAQYGYEEFPLVQRQQAAGGWARLAA